MLLVEEQVETSDLLERPGRNELKAQFIELRAKGWSYARISQELGVSKGALANWSAELEGEIAQLKAIELEALYESFYLTKENRIKLLGSQLQAIASELQTRDLAEVSTDKLLELGLRVFQALKEEYVEVRPLSSQEINKLNSLAKSGE